MPSPRAPQDKYRDSRDSRYSLPLPSHTMCLKALRHWVARAGIQKHITWHCARHSCGTNLLSNGANIASLSTGMGISHRQVWETDRLHHAQSEEEQSHEFYACQIHTLSKMLLHNREDLFNFNRILGSSSFSSRKVDKLFL